MPMVIDFMPWVIQSSQSVCSVELTRMRDRLANKSSYAYEVGIQIAGVRNR